MTSQINYSSINTSYPQAGVDNDSQGFRDNFSAIQLAFSTASNEITNLQLYTAKTNTATNFNGNELTNAVMLANPISVDAYPNTGMDVENDFGTNNNLAGSGVVTINYGDADYLITKLYDDTTYTIVGWPSTGCMGKITFQIVPASSTTATVTFSGGPGCQYVWWDNVTIANGGYPFTSTTALNQIWDVWSYDSGKNLFVQLKGLWGTGA